VTLVLALILRIRRALQARGQDLKVAKGEAKLKLLGRYFVIGNQGVTEKNVDLERLARKLDCIEPWEKLDQDSDQ
jgi:hypothetical protein